MTLKSEISIFSKDELPIWNEIITWYREYYTKGDNVFDPSKDSTIHKYWKIPEKKVLFALVCNQFNKMLTEDGYKDDLLIMVSSIIHSLGFIRTTDISFYLREEDMYGIKFGDPGFYIYNIKNPNGTPDPFMSGHQHVCVNDIDQSLMSVHICIFAIKSPNEPYVLTPNEPDSVLYKNIIEHMMTPFKEYFGGEAIGFKENGKLIIQHNTTTGYYMGYDPAK